MIDDGKHLERLSDLCALYRSRWGKEVDLLALPTDIRMIETLEHIIDTGESPLVGWAMIKGRKEVK